MQNIPLTKHQILEFLNEDGADKTTLAIPSISKKEYKFQLISKAKNNFIFCGAEVMNLIFNIISNKKFEIHNLKQDGETVTNGEVVLEGRADISSFLLAERTALNLIQHLSAVATNAFNLKAALNKDSIKILDTRKTLPGMRYLQKYATQCGGITNHRFGLGDLIMIKDNHIKASGGSIKNAILEVISNNTENLKIEVECETLEDVQEAVKHNIHRIMLDNMDIETIKEASSIIRNTNIQIEVSGNINLHNISNFSNLDIDFISCGCITHSVNAVDISAKLII